jgi:hypothetical protein
MEQRPISSCKVSTSRFGGTSVVFKQETLFPKDVKREPLQNLQGVDGNSSPLQDWFTCFTSGIPHLDLKVMSRTYNCGGFQKLGDLEMVPRKLTPAETFLCSPGYLGIYLGWDFHIWQTLANVDNPQCQRSWVHQNHNWGKHHLIHILETVKPACSGNYITTYYHYCFTGLGFTLLQ